MGSFFEGFLLSASLILALGAQNIFVLESGLHRRRHLLVATVCSICDALLIAVGVLGAATIFVRVPALKIGFGAVGVAFLVFYGFKKIKEGLTPSVPTVEAAAPEAWSVKRVILLTLGFSLLNPHVYLDTVILIGGYAARFPELATRAQFGAGAATFSVIWFFGLATFSAALSAFLRSPRAMRMVALVSGLILLGLSLKLGGDVYGWLRSAPAKEDSVTGSHLQWPVRHLSIDIKQPPSRVYDFVADPENLPKWAGGLSSSIRKSGEVWLADSPMGAVKVRFAPKNEFGVVDHDVELPDGALVHNPLRVLPNGEGSEVVFTLFQRTGVTSEEFERDAGLVRKDLEKLKSLLE